ncbi:bifunctional polysaccharide deacetylase/glycosyltransferase family 2 protein [Actinoplanes sp. KI2]|uniref:bifunctional polysaccharide deacetylase/glycosyltransferase family 2 protein n=1 Tax=Actinoplanes sp. KI2 TaxID=2983315 RepID=UPI0021D5C65D|nr:bifunctional polysaccharide deacetylase/glycosyltransferase family 2 protein [Actinoplanes sp. KI2]MCU7730480.1 bifunctional polysaccharide deacetylase/glycosyltransferase family 2 protein [Actinoplanes sp. KI2]
MTVYGGAAPAASERRGGPRVLFALVALLLVATVVIVQGYTDASFSPDGTGQASAASGGVPQSVLSGGPIIGPDGSQRLPTMTVALTFDDGPDPTWTPRILDVLARYHVPATFFMIGSAVARHPELARRVVREGHEVGLHTFTHPDLSVLPAWRRDLENSQAQLAVAYATGRETSLLRPPYSSTASALTDRDYAAVRAVGAQGYVTVLDDLDSEDWTRPGVDRILRNATPRGNGGAVVLFHDAGGDRAQTVAALDRLIPALRDRGYRFATVTGQPNPAAGAAEVWRGRALAWTVRGSDGVVRLLWLLLIVAGGLIVVRTLILFVFAVAHARRRRAATWSWGPPVDQPVTIVVPAYNERETIGPAVTSMARSTYPNISVLVVDDESTDGTADAIPQFGNVRTVRIPSGGKARALNTGTALANDDLVVMVDADTVVTPDAVDNLVQPFADPLVGAVAGNVKVGNRKSLLGKWQHIEYVIGFNLDRRLYDTFGCIPTVPGALGAFRRSALAEVGGLSTGTLAEDTDLTLAIQQAGWRVVYQESAVAYTEAPATAGQLWRQRYRWSYGTMQALWKHRHGRFGRTRITFIALFSVLLPLLAPLIDLMAVYGLFFLDRQITIIGWLAMLFVQTVTAILAFRLDRESLRPLWTLPLQQVVYRQVMYAVLLASALAALTGRRLGWQKIRRTGDFSAAPSG